MEEYNVIGKRVPGLHWDRKVTGKIEYAQNLVLPKMLAGKVLRSPHAHAKILHIDTSRAKKIPG